MRGKAKAALPHFVELGEKKSSDLLRILDKYHLLSEKIILLSDENTATIGGNGMLDMLRSERLTVVSHSVDNSDDQNVARIAKTIAENQPQTVIGFGGGKVLDVSKLAAGLNNTKYVSIPTTLSNDGIASPVAVIKNRQNIPISHITATPYGVIIDLSIVRSAPRRHLMAGVGDLVTTCVSPQGRNRSAGERIGRGVSVEDVIRESPSVVEGIPTKRAVLALAGRHGVEMPITAAVHAVLFEGKPPLEAITELMSRPPKAEEPL